jgi:tRNA-Thr(GGU) m(6)t(6)A37 methyltransferase TsaA
MELKVIAYARNGHTDKFGIPRQSREESPIVTRIVFEPEFRVAEALRGIEGYSHLWLIWGFSETSRSRDAETSTDSWSPTVRPPRLGGNRRIGVFATRSPYRPNPLGLSSVRLIAVRINEKLKIKNEKLSEIPTEKGSLELIVSGADLLDGTPIYDIKPYLSFSDSHEAAQNGFAEETKDYRLEVDWGLSKPLVTREWTDNGPTLDRERTDEVSEEWMRDVTYILSQDPRPAYQDDPSREYKLDYAGYTITFIVDRQTVHVKKIVKI